MSGVVADASPLIAFAKIGHLHLLPTLFELVTIPEAVHTEIVILGAGLSGAEDFARAEWLRVESVANQTRVDYLQVDLDRGESEAIVLAQEMQADRFLVDEERARAMARILQIPHVGTAGLLILAKQLGHIERVAPLLDQLASERFYLSSRLVRQILHESGEAK